jgi:hypothetical protein
MTNEVLQITNRLIGRGMNLETIAGRIDYSSQALRLWRKGTIKPRKMVVNALKALEAEYVKR